MNINTTLLFLGDTFGTTVHYYNTNIIVMYIPIVMYIHNCDVHTNFYQNHYRTPFLSVQGRQNNISRIQERTTSLRFIGKILRVLRLEVSRYNVYITNQFQTTFARGGGGWLWIARRTFVSIKSKNSVSGDELTMIGEQQCWGTKRWTDKKCWGNGERNMLDELAEVVGQSWVNWQIKNEELALVERFVIYWQMDWLQKKLIETESFLMWMTQNKLARMNFQRRMNKLEEMTDQARIGSASGRLNCVEELTDEQHEYIRWEWQIGSQSDCAEVNAWIENRKVDANR